MVTFPDFQYIPPILSPKSPLSNLYNQVCPSDIQLDSPLGEKIKQEMPVLIIIHTPTKFKGGDVFPNIKRTLFEEDLDGQKMSFSIHRVHYSLTWLGTVYTKVGTWTNGKTNIAPFSNTIGWCSIWDGNTYSWFPISA